MPTGYTSDLYSGKDVEFNDFVLACARGMGAFIHQRDDSMHEKPTPIILDVSMQKNQIDKLQQEYDDFTALTVEDQHALYGDYVIESEKREQESEVRRKAVRKSYTDMLAKVLFWEVPAELQSLKEFMESQLRESIDFDTRKFKGSIPTFSEWQNSKTDGVLKSIDHWENSIIEEERRVRAQNNYYTLLMRALEM
jgi:hypothetical protein